MPPKTTSVVSSPDTGQFAESNSRRIFLLADAADSVESIWKGTKPEPPLQDSMANYLKETDCA
jgi:hypothetical protein